MFSVKSLAACAVATVAFAGLAGAANAAEIAVSGDIFWTSGATTAYSKVGDISAFSFDVDSALPSGSPSIATVTDFSYTLNNGTTGVASLSNVTFYSSGKFALDFSNGTIVTVSGANFADVGGSSNTITGSGYYPVTASITTPSAAGVGSAVVSVSAVPLPAAMPMFVAGLAGLGFIAWRRKTV
jgi:hypothetical protein